MKDPQGLMAFYADFDEPDVEKYRRWHNCEHMAERVSLPGFRRGLRYRGLDAPATFLMLYETDDAAVLGSEAYHAALNAPTAWTRDALTWFRNPARAIYTKSFEEGAPGWRPFPYMLTLRFNTDAARLPGIEALLRGAAAAAADRVRLYHEDEAISGMMTAERRIYSGGPGAQQYLALLERMEPFADGLPDADALATEGAVDIFADRFTIDFALEAPR
jgi:hypothetical protein